jgi:hypothetical protein
MVVKTSVLFHPTRWVEFDFFPIPLFADSLLDHNPTRSLSLEKIDKRG